MAEQHSMLVAVVVAVGRRVRLAPCVAVAAGRGIMRSCRTCCRVASRACGAAGGVLGGRCSCTCNVLHGSFGQFWGRAAGGGGAAGGLAGRRWAGLMCMQRARASSARAALQVEVKNHHAPDMVQLRFFSVCVDAVVARAAARGRGRWRKRVVHRGAQRGRAHACAGRCAWAWKGAWEGRGLMRASSCIHTFFLYLLCRT